MATLPAAWQRAFERDRTADLPADPLPERRLARLLAGFIAAGLFFLVAPGTLVGVWNLLGISSRHSAESVSRLWIQAHGHAQLFGWVGSFMIGIALYTVPKFRSSRIRSIGAGWAMLFLWTAAIAARWASAAWNLPPLAPAAAALELLVALMLIWQCSGRSRRRGADRERWTIRLIFSGFAGLLATLAYHLYLLLPPAGPLIAPGPDALLLFLALWAFCFPVAWGFSTRFLPVFLGLRQPDLASGRVGLVALAAAIVLAALGWWPEAAAAVTIAAAAAAWSLRLFQPAAHDPKVQGVDPRYPWFARAAFVWLILAAALSFGSAPGLAGASRHAFTVGFLATLILSIGPRILPAFLNSRELRSPRLMLASLVLLTLGCLLRVSAEPVAYAGLAGAAWKLLPVSAFLELAALLLFAANIGITLASPMPAWIERRVVNDELTLYWCIHAYPETRQILVGAGLATLARARHVPRSLSLHDAALADGVDPKLLVAELQKYFDRRLARALRGRAG